MTDPPPKSYAETLVNLGKALADPTPKLTAEERVVELTQALKVIDEMRRQNLARIDDAKRQAFEEVADYADKLAQESDTVGCGDIRDWCRAHALTKEQADE